jgi:hypothetical protein
VVLIENRRSLLLVQTKDVRGRQANAKSDCDNAAGRRTNDEVEIRSDRMFQVLLKLRQKRCREYAADAATIERENAVRRLTGLARAQSDCWGGRWIG